MQALNKSNRGARILLSVSTQLCNFVLASLKVESAVLKEACENIVLVTKLCVYYYDS